MVTRVKRDIGVAYCINIAVSLNVVERQQVDVFKFVGRKHERKNEGWLSRPARPALTPDAFHFPPEPSKECTSETSPRLSLILLCYYSIIWNSYYIILYWTDSYCDEDNDMVSNQYCFGSVPLLQGTCRQLSVHASRCNDQMTRKYKYTVLYIR
jgi:hypothetical protein